MEPLDPRTERKKERIREAALSLLSKNSPNKVSVREIAKEANVSPVTIYNYFESKENLINELVQEVAHDQLQAIRDIIESDLPFPEKMEKVVFSKTNMVSNYPEFLHHIMQDPTIQKYLTDIHEKESIRLTHILFEQGKQENYIAEEIPIELLRRILSLFRRDMLSDQSILLAGEKTNSPEIYTQIMEILTYGLIGKNRN